MATLGVDYSFSRPDLATLRREGKHFVVRYLSGAGKAIDAAEAAAIRAAGFNLVLNYETNGDMSGGFSSGVAAGKSALSAARLLHVPVRAVYFSDEQSSGSLPASVAYMRGVVSTLGRVQAGYYGRDRVHGVKDALPGVLVWQACYGCPRSAFDTRCAIRQTQGSTKDAGGLVDVDWEMVQDFGQCWIAPDYPGNLRLGDDNPNVGLFFARWRVRRFGPYLQGDKFGWLKFLAVKRFQRSFGHFESGVVDAKTWRRAWL